MKTSHITLVAALLLATFGPVRAQLSSTITSQVRGPADPVGRDCWLAFPSNQWGVNEGGKYMHLYITSTQNTTAWVEAGGTLDSVPVTAYKTSTYNVPITLEMESSGIVENKGIHVYSNDADISVYFFSSEPYCAEGSYVIPTLGWDTDYVVAAYESLFVFDGGYDEPSECVIVAYEDSTIVHITPSCNLRKCTTGNISGGSGADSVAYAADSIFSLRLDRGQSLQLMPVLSSDPTHFDLTGTILHSNYPIGVIGGSMDAQIPVDFPYSEFVCEMIPPVQSWGQTYYVTNFTQQASMTSHDVAQYLFVASKPGQTIYRQSCGTSAAIECTIANQFGIYWDEVMGTQKFSSDAPFLLVSYMNSQTYPDGVSGNGEPAEVTINPRKQFAKSIVFETPLNVGNIVPYQNYATIIVNDSDAKHTFFDGDGITSYPAECVDDTFEIFTIPNIAIGVHTVTSDSGVGVYLYGYGFDESYAWSTPSGVSIVNSPDSIPPVADTMSECYHSFVHVTDSGNLPNNLGEQSGLAAIWLDTSTNMTFQPDSNWLEGSGADTGGYSARVIDSSKPGLLIVDVSDLAGNLTTITTTYQTHYAGLEPALRNLGTWTLANPPAVAYDTIYNLGTTPYNFDELHLLHGNVGFAIFDSIGGPLDLSPIPVEGRRLIQIQFEALNTASAMDSIIFGTECELNTVGVIGNGGGADFTVSNQTWPNEPLPAPADGYPEMVTISNLSNHPITIDSAWWTDTVHFKPVTSFPLTIAASPTVLYFTIAYFPDANSAISHNSTQGSWFSPQVFESGNKIPEYDTLVGWAAPLSGVSETNAAPEATIIPAANGRSLEIILPADLDGPVNFQLVNVLGENVLRETFSAGTQTVDASSLPRGVYFYRLTSNQTSQSGKVILGE
jgi:hypothetical protein